MYDRETITCSKGKDGFDYVDITIVKDGKNFTFKALVKTGSDVTIINAKALGISTAGLKKTSVVVGVESIEVYEAEIESISIGEHEIYGVDMIYVSEMETFGETPILGSDYLGMMNIHKDENEIMVLEFDPAEIGNEIVEERRRKYLANSDRKAIEFMLDDFFFIEDGIYPTDFELVLVVMKDGDLSAGCVDRGSYYTEDNWRGVIRQGRGGIIEYDDILAWKPIEQMNVFDITE